MWDIVATLEFQDWFTTVDDEVQFSIREKLRVLEEFGPQLSRPIVDTVKGSGLSNLKELRIQSKGRPFRVFFVFDPKRNAVLLVGGDKTSDKKFYLKMIARAEKIYIEYLEDLK